MRYVALVLAFALLAASPGLAQKVQGKRAAPPDVWPVVYNGVRYVALRSRVVEWRDVNNGYMSWTDEKLDQNGGYIEARDEKTDALLWRLKVYTVAHNAALERDVQDVFIKSMEIRDGALIVVNERGDRFSVDLKDRKVKQLE